MPGILKFKIGNAVFAGLEKDMKRYQAFSNQQSNRRLLKGDSLEIRDVYSHLLAANKSSKAERPLFSPEDLVSESSLLITGGNTLSLCLR